MFLDTYAAQRLNEQEADRQAYNRSIAEHWRDDRRARPARRWAIVRVTDRLFSRLGARSRRVPRGAVGLVNVPGEASPSVAMPSATVAHSTQQSDAVNIDAKPVALAPNAGPVLAAAIPPTSIGKAAESAEHSTPRELAHTR